MGTAKPGMAHLPAQSCPRHYRDGLVRCSNYRFRPALCLRHRSIRPQRSRLDQRHSKPDGRIGCTSDHGAFPWDEAPQHLIRDRDRIYGNIVTRRLRAMGIRDKAMNLLRMCLGQLGATPAESSKVRMRAEKVDDPADKYFR